MRRLTPATAPRLGFALVLTLYLLTTRWEAMSGHQTSRLAAVESLVERGTLTIDASTYRNTEDQVRHQGKHYSSKPIGAILLGVAIYAPLHAAGLSLSSNSGMVIYLLTLFSSGLLQALLAFFLTKALIRRGLQERSALLWSLCIATGTLLGAYATTLNSHTPAAAIITIAALFALDADDPGQRRPFVVSGILAGLSTSFDVPAGLTLVGVLPLALFYKHRLLRPALWFGLGAAALIALHLLANLAAYGTPLIASMAGEYYFPGSYWTSGHVSISDAIAETRMEKLWNMVLGTRGLFWHIPIVGLGLWAVARLRTRAVRSEALMALSLLLLPLLFYVFKTDPKVHGGSCIGPRWLLPSVPLLGLLAAQYPLRKTAGKAVRAGLLAMTLLVTLIAAYNPWPPAFSTLPILDNVTAITASCAPARLDLVVPLEEMFIGKRPPYITRFAELLEAGGRYDLAEMEAKRAIAVDSNALGARLILVRSLLHAGDKQSATEEAERLESLAPDSEESRTASALVPLR